MVKTRHMVVPAMLIAFIIAFKNPVDIFVGNSVEFTNSIVTMLPTFLLAFLGIFTLFFIPGMLLILIRKEGDRYCACINTLALLIWFTSSFLFGAYGSFNGTGLSFDLTSVRVIIETTAWVLLLAATFVFYKKIKTLQFQAVLCILALVLAVTSYHVAVKLMSDSNNISSYLQIKADMFPQDMVTFSNNKNVMHFLFDESQSTTLADLLNEDPALKEKFDGFTFYSNTAANFPTTIMAIPAILTGKVYKNDTDKDEFTKNELQDSAFLKTLKTANFEINLFTDKRYCDAIPNECIFIHSGAPKTLALKLLDYSLFKSAPDILKLTIYRRNRWLLSSTFASFNHFQMDKWVDIIRLNNFNKQIKVAGEQPHYKFYHSGITHSPDYVAENCQRSEQEARSQQQDTRQQKSTALRVNDLFQIFGDTKTTQHL